MTNSCSTKAADAKVELVARALGEHGDMLSQRFDWDAAPDYFKDAMRCNANVVLTALEVADTRQDRWRPIETAPRDGTEIIIAWLDDHKTIPGTIRGVSKAKWVTAEFWADLEGGKPEEFQAGWYEPNYEDELCANVWVPLPCITSAEPRHDQG